MARAIALADQVRAVTSPNPWVGCVVLTRDGQAFEGATQPPGGPHAEAVALAAAGTRARGATVYVTLEPCVHHGRTGPCVDALIGAGVGQVVVGVEDPDPHVAGQGLARLRAAGIAVEVGVGSVRVADQLAPYLHHRRTGRPFVVLKLAATLDGRTAAPDGTSRWITGPESRRDAHRLRAESDAVLVGAGTVRTDDPALTVRDVPAPGGDPLRVVLGHAPDEAAAQPCVQMGGPLDEVLDELGQRDVVQLLVEGGPTVAGELHRAGLVNRYIVYLAPAFAGGDDGRPLLAGPGAPTITDFWRGRLRALERLGNDVKLVVDAGD